MQNNDMEAEAASMTDRVNTFVGNALIHYQEVLDDRAAPLRALIEECGRGFLLLQTEFKALRERATATIQYRRRLESENESKSRDLEQKAKELQEQREELQGQREDLQRQREHLQQRQQEIKKEGTISSKV